MSLEFMTRLCKNNCSKAIDKNNTKTVKNSYYGNNPIQLLFIVLGVIAELIILITFITFGKKPTSRVIINK